jgi:hypothetical protein
MYLDFYKKENKAIIRFTWHLIFILL